VHRTIARTVGDEDVVVRPGLDPGEHGAQRLASQRHRLAALLVVLHLHRAAKYKGGSRLVASLTWVLTAHPDSFVDRLCQWWSAAVHSPVQGLAEGHAARVLSKNRYVPSKSMTTSMEGQSENCIANCMLGMPPAYTTCRPRRTLR